MEICSNNHNQLVFDEDSGYCPACKVREDAKNEILRQMARVNRLLIQLKGEEKDDTGNPLERPYPM